MMKTVNQLIAILGIVLFIVGCSQQPTQTATPLNQQPQVKTSTTSVPPVTRIIVGKWMATGTQLGPMIIYRSKDKLYLRHRLADGTIGNQQLKTFQHHLGQAYRPAQESSKYWIVDRDGDLQSWGTDGYITMARRI